MKSGLIKKLLTGLITAVILVNPLTVKAQDAKDGNANFVDNSLSDLYVVLGAGAVGAVLGLSTLSFVETPKDHLNNVAIGGAIGIVVGVGMVVFNQATKSQSIVTDYKHELTPESSEGLARFEFSKQKIAQNYLMQPTVGYNFTF